MRHGLYLPLVAAGLSALSFCQVTVDGQRLAGEGYTLLSTQTVNTQFGDNQSELNAAWVRVTNGHLYLAIPGNLESNFNKFDLFIDSKAGGFNTLQANSGMDGANALDGLIFDSGFDPDFLIVCRRGNSRFYVNFGELGSSGSYDFFGEIFGTNDFGAVQDLSGSVTTGLDVAYNGLNSGGVSGGTGAADSSAAQAAFQGLEFGIPLDDLGWTGGDIQLCALIVSNSHSFLSNQFLGGLPAGQDNVGFARDLTVLGGDQHFAVPRIDAQVTTNCSVTNHSGGFPARLAAVGSNVVGDNDLDLRVTGLPTTGTTAYLFNAFLAPGQTLTTVSTPSIAGVAASGDVCIAGGTFGRHVFGSDIYMGTDGQFEITVDLTDVPSPRDGISWPSPGHYSTTVLVGETWYWQCWYRDPSSGAGHSNFSEAISVTFQ